MHNIFKNMNGIQNRLNAVLVISTYNPSDPSKKPDPMTTQWKGADELKRVSGDVFGRIYEYFLTQFGV